MLPVIPLLLLLWDFPRDYTPVPDQFLITYAFGGHEAMQEMQTPPSAVGACGTAEVDVFCTTLPGCPAAGEVVFFWAQAAWGDERSGVSERLACHIQAGCVCQVLPTGLDADGKPLPLTETAYVPPAVAAPPPFVPQYPPLPA